MKALFLTLTVISTAWHVSPSSPTDVRKRPELARIRHRLSGVGDLGVIDRAGDGGPASLVMDLR
jgi:hypothetical protein